MIKLLSFFVAFSFACVAQAQNVAINNDNSAANPSAALDVKSTTKGMLIPRMSTTERNALPTPATGLMVFDNTVGSFYYYNGSAWKQVGADNLGNHTATQNINLNGNYLSGDGTNSGLYVDNSGNVGIGTSVPGLFPGSSKYVTLSSTENYGPFPMSLELKGANTSTLSPFAQIDFASFGTDAENAARIDARRGGSTNMGTLVFSTNDGTTLTERLRIKDAGNVGINTGSTISTNALLAIKDGHIQTQQTTGPTVAALSAAGTSATATITSINPKSTDVAGRVTITTGTGAVSTGGYAMVTFNKTYGSNPIIMITPANANSGSAMAIYGWYTSSTTTGFTLSFSSPAVTSTPFAFNYWVIETQ